MRWGSSSSRRSFEQISSFMISTAMITPSCTVFKSPLDMLTDTIREVLDNVPPDVDVAMVLDAGNANLARELGEVPLQPSNPPDIPRTHPSAGRRSRQIGRTPQPHPES